MAVKQSRDGVSEDDLRDAIVIWRADPSDKNEAALLTVYERLTGYRPGCGDCVATRRDFLDGLTTLRAGDARGIAVMKLALQRAGSIVIGKLF